jgi:DNA-binding GntR family transcriptional regulator
VFEVRRLIEPTLIACFIKQASADEIAVLSHCIAQEEEARKAGDMRRAIRLSGDFHLHIANAAQHQTLGRILRELVSRTSLILMTYGQTNPAENAHQAACGCSAHRALVDAIRLRIPEQAQRLMQEHLLDIERSLVWERPDAVKNNLHALLGV